MFILDRIDRELLHSLERLEFKFGLSSEFVDKIPVRILLDVLFRVFRFSKESFCALTFHNIHDIHDILKLRRNLDSETYERFSWQFCNYKLTLKFRAKIKE